MDTHSKPPKLMDRVRATLRVKRYSPRTEKTYCYWIRYFIRFHGVRHPAGMGGAEVRAFLEHLTVGAVVLSHEDVMRVLSKINQHSPPTAQYHRGQTSAGRSTAAWRCASASDTAPCHVPGKGFAGVKSPLG